MWANAGKWSCFFLDPPNPFSPLPLPPRKQLTRPFGARARALKPNPPLWSANALATSRHRRARSKANTSTPHFGHRERAHARALKPTQAPPTLVGECTGHRRVRCMCVWVGQRARHTHTHTYQAQPTAHAHTHRARRERERRQGPSQRP